MTAELPAEEQAAAVTEAAPSEPYWTAVRRTLCLIAVAILALLGALALDRAGDPHRVFCGIVSESPQRDARAANPDCISANPVSGETWRVSARRYAAQSDGGVHAIVIVSKVLLYLAFALSTLELLLQLLEWLGVPALTLKSIREKYGDIKKPEADSARRFNETLPARIFNVFISFTREVVTHPQIAVTTVALLGVGGTVWHQVTNNYGLTADDAARIVRIEAQVQTMRSTLVSASGDELPPTPMDPPALALAVSQLKKLVDESSAKTATILGKLPSLENHAELRRLQVSVDRVEKKQEEFNAKLLPNDLGPALGRLASHVEGIGGQVKLVNTHLCGSSDSCLDISGQLARASKRSDEKLVELEGRIDRVDKVAAVTLGVANATRREIGFVRPLPTSKNSEEHETVGGGIARILQLEHQWAKNYFRLVARDDIKKLLEARPDIRASCVPPQECNLGELLTLNESVAPPPFMTQISNKPTDGPP